MWTADPVASPALLVTGASRRIGARALLTDVSLRVPPAGALAIMGPNGAGKSSLLRAVVGRLRLDAGRVEVAGQPVATARRAGRLGVVPQETALLDHLTVTENLALAARLAGVPARDVADRVHEGLAWAGLEARAQARVPTLSGGMRRRVHIVASTLHRPTLLALDEPTVGLDAESRERVRALLSALRDHGVALIMATHVAAEAAAVCDDVAVLAAGRVLAHGPMAALVEAAAPGARELRVSLEGSIGTVAERLLRDAGCAQEADGDWVTTTLPSLSAVGALEVALAPLGVRVVDAAMTAPGLQGTVARLVAAAAVERPS